MDRDTIKSLIPAYALGAVDPDERQVVEAHLSSCPVCRALLDEHQLLVDDLLFAMPPMAAPVGITERMQRRLAPVTTQTTLTPRWARFRKAWAIPALAAAIVLLVSTNVYWFGRTTVLERQSVAQALAFTGLANAPAVSLRADASATRGQGMFYASDDGQIALVCVYYMPELPADKTYQVWLLKDGVRESGGVFNVTQDGFGLAVIRPQGSLADYDAVGITVEPAGGSSAPTSPRVIGASI